MGLVKITLCFSLSANAMAYLSGGDKRKGFISSMVFLNGRAVQTLTQHTRFCQQKCAQTQGQTHCYQYTKWPPAGKGRE